MQTKIKEISEFLNHGDLDLTLRRITDCTLDSNHLDLFEKCLNLHKIIESKVQQEQLLFGEKTRELLANLNEISIPTPLLGKPILNTENLGKTYGKGGFGIAGVNTSLKYGEIIGLVGENGNGKTTLLRLIGGELGPSKGNINYHFSNAKRGSYDLKSAIIFVPQRIPRWYGQLMDNLKFTNAIYGRKGRENNLWAELMVARMGLRPYKHLTWNRISSGYKTRFEIAKVLLQKPQLLLLDEPLANLDIFAQQTLLNDLKQRAKSSSQPFGLMMSSQQLYEVEKVSDSIIFLKDGQPKYQNINAKEGEPRPALSSVFEIETNESLVKLKNALMPFPNAEIKYNGGAYIIDFNEEINGSAFFQAIGNANLEVNMIRNISKSSRRFFNK